MAEMTAILDQCLFCRP